MKTVTLSDHTSEQVEQHSRGRQETFVRKQGERQEATVRRDAQQQVYRDDLGKAFRNREVVGTIKGAWNFMFGELPYVPPAPQMEAASREEEVWKAGNDGEQRVANFLASKLSDEWILISGFMTGKGEIDLILVGPAGVFAMEVKFVRGVVHCDGDRWWRDKSDNYGNVVERDVPIKDARGRGPSRQLNETADVLQNLLNRRFGEGRVRRVVVLAHEQSKLGNIKNSTVDAVVSLSQWNTNQIPGAVREVPPNIVQEVASEIAKRHFGNSPRTAAK